MVSARSLFALIVVTASSACTVEPLTEVVVVTDTDLAVPSEIDTIRISVSNAAGVMQEAVADLGAGAPRPVTVDLLSRSGEGTLEVIAIGERAGVEIVRRTARVSFVRGRTMVYRMDLWASCVGVLCGAERSCGDSGCRAVVVEESELAEWNGAPPGAPDAGVPSDDGGGLDGGGRDGGIADAALPADGAPVDAALPVDARSLDALVPIDARTPADAWAPVDAPVDAWVPVDAWTPECTVAGDCADGWTCTLDECIEGRCMRTPRDAACDDGIECTTQRCDATAGCVYEAHDSMCDDSIGCTTDTCDRLYGCANAPEHEMCELGSYCDDTTGCTVGPSWTEVYTEVIAVRCAPCHVTTDPPSGTLPMGNHMIARASLVGVVARCGAGANTRVIPRDSARSLLWRKVAGVDLCGVRMPRMLEPLSAEQIAMIQQWIDSGALE